MDIQLLETGTRALISARTGWGYTYFVRHGNAIKIGHSGCPKSRLSKMNHEQGYVGNPASTAIWLAIDRLVFIPGESQEPRALAIADERAAAANALAQAMDQLLDDMGKHGMSVCLAAKAQGRIAYEPFWDKEAADDYMMSLEEATRILKECER